MSLFDKPNPPSPQQGLEMGQQVAAGQQTYNTEAGQASQAGSMVNQYNPLGSLTYKQTGTSPDGTPLYSSTMEMSPEQAQLFNLLTGTKTAAGTQGQQLLQGANYGATQSGSAIGDATSGATKALMDKQMEYYQPFFTTERNQLDAQLRNQGLGPGSPLYDNAMRQLDTNHGLVMSKAAADFENQAYGQAKQNYEEPAAMAMTLAGFGAPGDPKSELINTPGLNVQPANLIGATSDANKMLMDQYKAQMDQYQAGMSGLFGIPSAVLGGWAKGGFPGLSSLGGGAGAAAATDSLGLTGGTMLGGGSEALLAGMFA